MTSNAVQRRIAVGSDHGGFHLKEAIRAHLERQGHALEDVGTRGTESCDYPKFAHAVAERVSSRQADFGIVVDRAGIGSAMAANKLPGVRAALCYDLSSARNSREHNNANVLTLGAGLIGPDLALQIVDLWLATECVEERHLRRARMIDPAGEVAPGAAAGGAPVRDSQADDRDACRCAASGEEPMENLSGEDLDRIAARVAELSAGRLETSPTGAGQTGAQPAPADVACAFCQACAEANPEFMRRLVEAGAERLGHQPGAGEIPNDLAKYIDHTLLKPDATAAEITKLCEEAAQHGFASVCVNPTFIRLAAQRLRGTSVKVCSVVGFPFGTHLPEVKADEARRAIRDGAREIDMVINIGALKGGDDALVYRDIRAVTDACQDRRAICKVIIETALLSDEEKVRACVAARKARADFVKTSTGFASGGATAADVALMARVVADARMGVKASGGVRSYSDFDAMVRAGATRIGASAGIKIIKEAGS
jgi:deoxyribose-phosphate aldolase